jgi:hemerythrin-like domain-containing protein
LLLKALEQEVAVFERAERPDYEVLEAIVVYFQGYPDCCHHPKEDVVFEKLKQREPAAVKTVGDLDAEHVELAERLRNFASVVENVLSEQDMPRETLSRAARDFVERARRHMRKEEETFFSAALDALTEEDWAELDKKVTDEKDPLFAEQPAQEFAALRERILRWKQEDQAQRNLAD